MTNFEPFDCPGCGAKIESEKVAKFHKDAPPTETPPTAVPAAPAAADPATPPTDPAKPVEPVVVAPKPARRFDFSTTLFGEDD